MSAALPSAVFQPQPDLAAPGMPSIHSARGRTVLGIGVAGGLHLLALMLVMNLHGEPTLPLIPPHPVMTVSLTSETPLRPPSPTPPTPVRSPQPIKTAPAAKPDSPHPTPTPAERPGSAPAPSESSTAAASAVASSSAPVAAPPRELPPVITQPRFDAAYLANPAPPYPGMSRRLGEQGRVLLRVKVGSDGQALEVSIAQSSGFPRLDDAAAEAVRRWRFVPARQGEQPVVAAVNVPIVFNLNPIQ